MFPLLKYYTRMNSFLENLPYTVMTEELVHVKEQNKTQNVIQFRIFLRKLSTIIINLRKKENWDKFSTFTKEYLLDFVPFSLLPLLSRHTLITHTSVQS